MPKNYLFLSLLLFFFKLSAQKNVESDFILTLNGERIEGEIKLQTLREHQKGCQFKAKDQSTYQTYTPAQLQAFYTRKTYFVSKLLPDSLKAEQLFLECYFQGKYSLYARGNQHYIEGDSTTLRPLNINGGVVSKDGVVVKRADGGFLKLLRRFSRECAGLGLQIQANVQSYDLKSFLDLLEDYHKCLNIPYKRYGISSEIYQVRWEAGAALGAARMSLKSSYLGLGFYELIPHQGTGFSINAAMVLSPQRYIFFPALIVAPEWARYSFQQNDTRFVNATNTESTYIESHYEASVFAIPLYLRQPIVSVKSGFLSFELGARLESVYSFTKEEYLIETEGIVDRQYPFVSTQLYTAFEERDQAMSVGLLTGLRLSIGDRANSMGRFSLGLRYNRGRKKDPGKGDTDHPLLFRNTSYNVYLTTRF